MKEKILSIYNNLIDFEKKLSEMSPADDKYREILKKYTRFLKIKEYVLEYKKLLSEEADNKSLLKEEDSEMLKLVESEFERINKRKREIEEIIKSFLLKGMVKNRNIIVEIRAGTGGEEAGLFASDLFRMYVHLCERKSLKYEILDSHPTDLGGFKEVIFSVSGNEAYYYFYFEGGVHRVQRVPVTEAGGRIHTSACSVVVLPEPEELEVKIDPKELKIDTFRSSGKGGQHLNVTDSAVRITHVPTGIVVSCQDERSQTQNKNKAMKILRARLLNYYKEKESEKVSTLRKNQAKSADRSDKIRTYNFPQNRVTDHRINYSVYNLEEFLNGNIDEIVEKLWEKEFENI